jgi:hypothetical protein
MSICCSAFNRTLSCTALRGNECTDWEVSFQVLVSSWHLRLDLPGNVLRDISRLQFCIVTRLRAWRPGFDYGQGQGKDSFISPSRPDRLWGPLSLLSNGNRGLKRPGREVDHSPPSDFHNLLL